MRRLLFVVLTLWALSLSAENRVLDERYKQHCSQFSLEECRELVPEMAEENLENGCLTREEYESALSQSRTTTCVKLKGKQKFSHWCYCSCFEKGTRIGALLDGRIELFWEPIEQLVSLESPYSPVSFSNDGSPVAKPSRVKQWSAGQEERPLFVFETKSGRRLSVTPDHVLVTASGVLRRAEDLSSFDMLLGVDGKADQIVRVSQMKTDLDVYNILLGDDTSHLLAAEGLIVGDLAFENWLSDEVGSVAVRE